MLDRSAAFFARFFALIVFITVIFVTSFAAEAQQRMVIVNGQPLSPQELYVLDSMNGAHVPNGAYWLDFNTGVWGYAGDPTPRGIVGAGAGYGGGQAGGYGGGNAGAAGSGLYAGQLDRGPFGTYMSDGNCSFVSGVPVGNC